MRPLPCMLAMLGLAAVQAQAQTSGLDDPLLDRMIGDWVLEGTIAGNPVTHDVVFEWVLEHNYVQFHEIARERDAAGRRAYEAIVFIGWDAPGQRYACLWLDSTGGGGLSAPPVIGYGPAAGDSIPFVFRSPDGSSIHTTFSYSSATDTWQWHIDNEENGVLEPFARVTLTRKR